MAARRRRLVAWCALVYCACGAAEDAARWSNASLPSFRCDKDASVDRRRADVGREPALLFVHVFKAAGSSVRGIFRRYAERCGKRWACLVTCGDGGAVKADGTLPCRLRDLVNLDRGAILNPNEKKTGRARMRRNPDARGLGRAAHIIGGHYHFGLHAILPPDRPYAYFTCVREPMATWISGLRYNDRKLDTVPTLVAAMARARPPGSKRHYANALTYLVESAATRKQSADRKLELARANLGRVALVGVVESWQATVDLLAAHLDPAGASPHLWDRHRHVKRANVAKTALDPKDVVASIRADPELAAAATAYLATENALYEACLAKHAAACRGLLGDRCRLRWRGGLLPLLNASLLAPDLLDAPNLAAAAALNAPRWGPGPT